jgi:spore germination protein GerM
MTVETPAKPPARPRPARTRWLIGVAVVGALTAATWALVAWWPPRPASTASAGTAPSASADSRRIHALLFYLSEDGTELVESSREIAYGATPVEQARLIVEAQLRPAPGGMTSAIPAGTTMRALFLTARGEAYVDLSREVVSGHPGGSLDEALTVFTIVNALTVNLPTVSAVQILVDGKAVDTLAGHIDLRHPLERSLKWVRKGQ